MYHFGVSTNLLYNFSEMKNKKKCIATYKKCKVKRNKPHEIVDEAHR